MDFAGKVIVITGAGSGIGRATAIALAERGGRIGLLDRDTAGLADTRARLAAGGQAVEVETDVTSPESIARAFTAVTDRLGAIDLAVNNAGILGEAGKTVGIPLEMMRRIFEVNVFGLFSCLKAELEIMLPRRRGAIVNVASAAGLVGAPYLAAYGASKHAVVGLTRSAAVDHAASGVRINAVCPGLVETPMVQAVVGEPRAAGAAVAQHPIGRLAKPEEVASAIVWLLSDAASFVTGSAMPVDGGFTAL